MSATTPANLNPRKLVLGLLLAADGEALASSQAVEACALFGFSESSARVAITRLAADHKLASAGRGLWVLGDEARALASEAGRWRRAEERVRRWRGDYVAAHTGSLGRRDRTRTRRRDRALALTGFRELERGLFVRPNNVDQDLEAIRQRLFDLGLDRTCAVFGMGSLDTPTTDRVLYLWDTEALNRHYRTERVHLEAWMAAADALEPHDAARESYVLGSSAIRSLVFDPWLPEPFVDVAARHAFFETVCRFDDAGKAIWADFASAPLPAVVGAR